MATAGQIFGKYSLVLKLAAGGQGEIFLARLEGAAGFEKLVVIKRLLPHLADDSHFTKMLVDEARIAAKIDHVNVCQAYELGQVNGSYYLAMEYLEGVPLSRILQQAAERRRKLDIRLVAAILQQTCEGLHHAHELRDTNGELIGVVHRDTSPSNLFVTVDGYVKLLDFGVAKARGMLSKTRTGTIKGKYEYMSPEQVLRRPLDRRSDVFSLGIVLYEALTVRRLFYRETEFEVFRAITEEPLPSLSERRPDAPPELVEVLERALCREPSRRFATARDFRRALIEATASLGPPLNEEVIGEYVRTQFADELEARRDAIAASIARIDEAAPERASEGDGDVVTFAPVGDSQRGAGTQDIGLEDTAVSEVSLSAGRIVDEQRRRERTRRLALWSLVIVLAVAAGAVAALMYFPQDTKPEVVVVHGQVTSDDGGLFSSNAPPRDAAPAASAGKKQYTAAFSKRKAEVTRCFEEHGTQNVGSVKLGMSIDGDGHVSRAWLEPKGLTDTPLGQCIRDIAETTEFGPQERPAQVVRIPFRFR